MVACLLLRGAACPVPAAEDPGVGLVSRFTEASLAASSFDAGSSRRSELVLVPYDSLSNGEVDLELDMMAARTDFLLSLGRWYRGSMGRRGRGGLGSLFPMLPSRVAVPLHTLSHGRQLFS